MSVTTTPTTIGFVPEFDLADRLRKARESTGLKQAEFAEVSNISAGSVHNYENRKTRPRKLQLRAWALATGVDLDWLTTGVENHDDGPTDPSEQVSKSSPCMTDDAKIYQLPAAA